MTGQLRPLGNDAWGVESSCFVCEPTNTAGLRIPFHHDVAAERVVARFALDERFSGAPRYVHGGVLLAILDEAMAWATIAIAERFALTLETTSRFERPVALASEHHVRAWIDGIDDRSLLTAAEIVGPDGGRCVTAYAEFRALDLEQATDAAGAELGGDAERLTT